MGIRLHIAITLGVKLTPMGLIPYTGLRFRVEEFSEILRFAQNDSVQGLFSILPGPNGLRPYKK